MEAQHLIENDDASYQSKKQRCWYRFHNTCVDRYGIRPRRTTRYENDQYQLLLNATVKDLLPVADGLDACAVPEPSVLEEEAATEELPAAADNSAKPIDGGLERNTVYTFFCWVGSSISSVYYPRA